MLPLLAIGAALAPAIIGGLQSRANRKAQKKQNEADRQFQRESYAIQRQDALADWNMQNAYNSPAQQMQRYQEAGLNPNLIYGQQTQSVTARSSEFSGGNQQAPQHDLSAIGQIFAEFMRIQQVQAQTDNTRAHSELIAAQERMAELQGKKISVDTEETEFNLALKKKTEDQAINRATLENEKLKADIAMTIDENARKELRNSVDIEKTVQEILKLKLDQALQQQQKTTNYLQQEKIKQEIEHIKQLIILASKEGVIKNYDIRLRAKNTNPGDPGYWRSLMHMLDGVDDVLRRVMPGTWQSPR